MFRCNNCDKISEAGEKQNKVVTETRQHVHYQLDKNGETYIAGRGTQIVKEINYCARCHKEACVGFEKVGVENEVPQV